MIFIISASELFGTQWTKEDCVIRGITCNSQRIKPGYVFVCLEGEKDTGFRYIEDARNKGAAAILADSHVEVNIPVILCANPRRKMAELAKKIYQKPDEKMTMTGVTGTNGKTTVTHLIRDCLIEDNRAVGMIGTNGCYYNNTLLDESFTTSTTPESGELYKILDSIREQGAEYTVMEVSSHALSLDRVYSTCYDIAAFTNLTQDHLDFHKSMEKYYFSKEKLFEMSKQCVINTDDEYGRRLYEKYKNKSVSYGLSNADITAENIINTSLGSRFLLKYNGEAFKSFINIPGDFSVYNALCAYGVSRLLGIENDAILKALAKTKGVTGRVERVNLSTDFSVIIDYAHSPDGLSNIIKAAKGFTAGKVITLFGCGGDRDREKRAIMGEISGLLSDFTVITSDNPRYEDPIKIIRDIEKGIVKITNNYAIVPERYEAIEYAVNIAKPGDTVLLCGKGHENYIIKGSKKIHFDEREALLKILKNKRQETF